MIITMVIKPVDHNIKPAVTAIVKVENNKYKLLIEKS